MKLRKQCIYSCMYSGILLLWTLHSHITLFQLSLDAEKDPVTVLLLGRLYIVMPPSKLCQHSVSLQDFFLRSHSADSAGCHPHFASSLHRLPHSFPECWVVLKIRMKCTRWELVFQLQAFRLWKKFNNRQVGSWISQRHPDLVILDSKLSWWDTNWIIGWWRWTSHPITFHNYYLFKSIWYNFTRNFQIIYINYINISIRIHIYICIL